MLFYKNKNPLIVSVLVLISIASLSPIIIYLILIFNITMPQGRNYIRSVALYHTNHEMLRDICRDIIREKKSKTGNFSDTLHVLKLKPRVIDVLDDSVSLNLGYGISIYVYSEGSKGFNTASVDAGFIELIDGLWYYDSALVDNPEYIKVLDKLKDRDIGELKKPPWYNVD